MKAPPRSYSLVLKSGGGKEMPVRRNVLRCSPASKDDLYFLLDLFGKTNGRRTLLVVRVRIAAGRFVVAWSSIFTQGQNEILAEILSMSSLREITTKETTLTQAATTTPPPAITRSRRVKTLLLSSAELNRH